MHDIQEVGIVTLVCYFVVKESFALVKNVMAKKNNPGNPGNSGNTRSYEMQQKIRDLWDWHNKEDPQDGVKLMYFRRSLDTAIQQLTIATTVQTDLLKAIKSGVGRIENKLDNPGGGSP